MPKNLHGGSKAKRSSNKNDDAVNSSKNEFVEKSKDGTTVYGKIIRKLGCGFIDVLTEEKKIIRCSICGKFSRKSKSWSIDDVVIVDKMLGVTKQDKKGIIVFHLSPYQVHMLVKKGDITKSTFSQVIKKGGTGISDDYDSDDDIQFDYDEAHAPKTDNDKSEEQSGCSVVESEEDVYQNPNRPAMYSSSGRKKNTLDDDSNSDDDSTDSIDVDDV